MLSAITKNSTIPICKVTSFQDNSFSWFEAVFLICGDWEERRVSMAFVCVF